MKATTSDRTERRGIAITAETFESLGFAFREQHESDYGVDAHLELIENERPTGRLLGAQIKSGPSYFSERSDQGFVFREDAAHIEYWLSHCLPIVICLVDVESRTIYWQSVSEGTVEMTGKQYKVIVPYDQCVDRTAQTALCAQMAAIVPRERYTIFETGDVSHATAKRYRFAVVLNGTLSKAEILNVVRTVTGEGARSRYYRSSLVEDRWGDSDAHVVWTFVYPSAEDRSRHNHVCRSLWIDPDLDDKARPGRLYGEAIGDNLVIDWNERYAEMSALFVAATLSKKDYLDVCLPAVDELSALLLEVSGPLRELVQLKIKEAAFLEMCAVALDRFGVIYRTLIDLGHPPYECREMDAVLQSFIASLDNFSLCFSERGRSTWEPVNRYWISINQLEAAEGELDALRYEIKKILR